MKTDGVARAIAILRILFDLSDEDHYLTIKEISDELSRRFDICAYRTTIQNDIDALIRSGFGIECVRSTQNRYCFHDRWFGTAEIRVLIDAIESARFISPQMSRSLEDRLISLAGDREKSKLLKGRTSLVRFKTNNTRTIYSTDAIENAIDAERKIAFEYGGNRKMHTVSPYRLLWFRGLYLLIGYDEDLDGLKYFRIDWIRSVPEVLPSPARRSPGAEALSRMTEAPFIPDKGEYTEVTFAFRDEVRPWIMLCFGEDVNIEPWQAGWYRTSAEVICGPELFAWVFSFAGKMKIISPYMVKESYRKMVREESRRASDVNDQR